MSLLQQAALDRLQRSKVRGVDRVEGWTDADYPPEEERHLGLAFSNSRRVDFYLVHLVCGHTVTVNDYHSKPTVGTSFGCLACGPREVGVGRCEALHPRRSFDYRCLLPKNHKPPHDPGGGAVWFDPP